MGISRRCQRAAAVLAAIVSIPASARAQSTCLLNNREAALRREAIARSIADSVTRTAAFLPAVPDSAIVAVRDERTCVAARKAYNAALPLNEQSFDRPVHVIKVGNVYSVDDPTVHFGEYRLVVTLNASFGVLTKRTW